MSHDLDRPIRVIGEEWEEEFWGLLRRRYGRARLTRIPATMGGDRGLEGFSHDGIGYQCFADRDSVTLRHRTDKQKNKIRDDTNKLQSNHTDLVDLLGGVVLERWVLAVPEYHAAELIAYANRQAAKVLSWGLPFIAHGFRIVIQTDEDYPAEKAAAMHDGLAKARVRVTEPTEEDLDLFREHKPELVATLETKLEQFPAPAPGGNRRDLRDRFLKAFLTKEQIMQGLEEWPDTREAVERARALRQEIVELESDLGSEAPERRVTPLIRDYVADLERTAGGVTSEDAQRLAVGTVGEWLIRCPLRFRGPS